MSGILKQSEVERNALQSLKAMKDAKPVHPVVAAVCRKIAVGG